ncbi:peptidase M61 [Mucilaginibacter hurinus]|uniref:Peptidase M61 n=1 Tax=Mucilaginibacter hurinus TaxID=2201324 RepID=A0A367GLA9_9SPHI|nr:PDZ domain-containing protein [Mucilaginibacter hurinus]RCH53626.1 peptidase M61 [Mucilaginibacter hurinus]
MSNMAGAAGNTQITYTVTFPEAQAHYIDVEMHIKGLKQQATEIKMPVWAPGSYLVREFAKNVEGFVAEGNGSMLYAVKTSKNTWRVSTAGVKDLTVRYRVYAFEISVRTSFVDASHAFLSNSGVFMYPKGMLNEPSTVKIIPYKGWTKVSTGLDAVGNDPFVLKAPNYDILFDSPIEVGTQDTFDFIVDGVKYEMAMYGSGTYNKDRLTKDLTKLIKAQTSLFGENPNKRYTFIVHHFLKGGGGLEHLNSTVLGASRDAYSTEKGYQGFLELASHEHFHLWNVKRLRPIALGPFDYENENYTTNLWIAEGFTAYFEYKTIRQASLYPESTFITTLTGDINTNENQPGGKIQSVAESSFDAWIKYYRPNENSANSTISYYGKGSLIGYLLDLEIINSSNAQYSLDDVMRYMYNEYYKSLKRGYTDAEFKLGLEKFAGKKLDNFYRDYINGVTVINHDKYLGYAGYKLIDELAGSNTPALGVATSNTNNRFLVTTVSRNTSAWVGGINVNDELVAIDGTPVTDMTTILNGKKPGDKIDVTINRDGLEMILPIVLLKSNKTRYKIEPVDNPSKKQLSVRQKWLAL